MARGVFLSPGKRKLHAKFNCTGKKCSFFFLFGKGKIRAKLIGDSTQLLLLLLLLLLPFEFLRLAHSVARALSLEKITCSGADPIFANTAMTANVTPCKTSLFKARLGHSLLLLLFPPPPPAAPSSFRSPLPTTLAPPPFLPPPPSLRRRRHLVIPLRRLRTRPNL